MFMWSRKSLWLVLLGFWLPPALGQHLSWRNYTADQGLPDNEVYRVLPDSKGRLWFATNQGICRFNGYEFVRPIDTSAQRGSEAFLPTEDAQGRIWFTRLDGSVWRVENDSIKAWEHNAVAAPYREKFTLPEHLVVDEKGAVWLALNGLGILEVQACGAHRVIACSPNQDALILARVAGKLLYTSQIIDKGPDGYLPFHERFQAAWEYHAGALQPLPQLPLVQPYHHSERGVWALSNGGLLFCFRGVFYFWLDGSLRWRSDTGIWPQTVKETSDGGVLVASHLGPKPGLFYYASIEQLQRGKGRNLLPGNFVTDISFDREGGWWAATFQGGLWYCKNPRMEVFSRANGLPADDVLCLAGNGTSTVYAGLRPLSLVSIDAASGALTHWPKPPFTSRSIDALYFDTNHQRLWGGNPIHFMENGRWHLAIWTDNNARRKGGLTAKNIAQAPFSEALWAGSPQGFIRIDARGNKLLHIGGKNEPEPFMRTFSVTPDTDGSLWITTPKGLKHWKGNGYESPPFDHPALRFQPRNVAILPSGGMAITLLGAGLLIRDAEGCFTHLTERQGLSTDFITKLYCHPDGVLFACSNAGLNRLSLRSDGGWDIMVVDSREGLPSNHINDVLVLDGKTWVATDKGLARFRELPASVPMPVPELERLLINNVPSDFVPNLKLRHDQNNLSIRFFALHYRSEGQILYRYRLNGADTVFTHTRTREVHFANLAPGVYALQVQAQNEAGEWSPLAHWGFRIQAAWWQTGWFWSALIALLATGLALWYRSRLLRERREAETSRKISELEAAALRAQMNPHFIFNCLSSIQYFIAENDAAAATRYLARFARLVRLALHGSVDGTHSLREEIEMLDSYLALEQLRFRDRFSYAIETTPDLDLDGLALPPMLVQPFLENALLHGMKNKAEGGRIAVAFAQQQNQLLVTITDNGPGFDAGSGQTGPYKSVGMMLTQRRLEVLSGRGGGQAFSRENILGADGAVCGTKVVLKM
jgi:ligand-binding sensor domain-containing protein